MNLAQERTWSGSSLESIGELYYQPALKKKGLRNVNRGSRRSGAAEKKEVGELLGKEKVDFLLALGGTEQHGSRVPLGADE